MQQPAATAPNLPIAAIDVGSNTIHLVVARPRPHAGEGLEVLVDELEFVRLGAGVGTTGRIAPERAERGMAALRRLRDLAAQAGASIILGAATEVMRLATNGPEFLARAKAELGLDISIISGEQEAALTFWGANSGRQLAPEQPVAVADLGGGSIELVLGSGQRLDWRRSLPLGSGTLHDRFFHIDPPAPGEMEALRREVAAVLEKLTLPGASAKTSQAPDARRVNSRLEAAPPSPPARAKTNARHVDRPAGHSQEGRLFIVCGGTATTMLFFARSALGIPAEQTHLSRAEMAAAIELLARLPAQEIAERYGVEAQRARILSAGALVLAVLMEHLRASAMQISQRGIREGMILSYARHGVRWLDAAQRGEA